VSASADNSERHARSDADSFSARGHSPAPGLASEFIQFLRQNKTWWLAPILLTLALIGLIVSLGGTAAAPWIYTLF